ncbi:hypothetical protein R1flu_014942 [Riccia fluitans]|uniref:Secreted protein n=1 Tax=Riccia fluitans TaxID=41844 RepID=A0ABD1YHI0_9MARC
MFYRLTLFYTFRRKAAQFVAVFRVSQVSSAVFSGRIFSRFFQASPVQTAKGLHFTYHFFHRLQMIGEKDVEEDLAKIMSG